MQTPNESGARFWSFLKRPAGMFLILGVVFFAGLYAGIHQTQTEAAGATSTITLGGVPGLSGNEPKNVDLTAFWKSWNLLSNNFVQAHATGSTPTDQEKVYGAIQGLVDSYKDPYTTFFPPADAAVFDQDISGSFSGVGMEMGADKDGALVVISPLKGSPAEAAGVKSGDKILMIGATTTDGMRVDQAVKLIRGVQGTSVKLTLSRSGVAQPMVISITRDTIKIPTIDYKNNVSNGIFEIDLYNFSAVSPNDFREALRSFFQSGDTRLILDLRGNPGGYLDAAVDMASFFLPAGETIVTEDYRGTQPNSIHRSLGYNVFANKKLSMAILTDQGTASAAEILAGALQQHGIAKVIGTRTFGKGSVQQLFDLGGGAELKVTVARWLTPNGTSISDGGLKPDIQATTTAQQVAAGQDPQKDAAIQYLINQ
jgi:carboxyl-terminal processing protease